MKKGDNRDASAWRSPKVSIEETLSRDRTVAGRFQGDKSVLIIPSCELDEGQAIQFLVSLLGMMEWQTVAIARTSASKDINSPVAVEHGKTALARLKAQVLTAVEQQLGEQTGNGVRPRITSEISHIVVMPEAYTDGVEYHITDESGVNLVSARADTLPQAMKIANEMRHRCTLAGYSSIIVYES